MKKSTSRTANATNMVTVMSAVMNRITIKTAIIERQTLNVVSSTKTTYCSKSRYSVAYEKVPSKPCASSI